MSRFVSAGINENEAAASSTTERDEAWSKAQQQIDATRQQTSAEKPRTGEQEGGKSLYETLQANKGDFPEFCLSLGQAIRYRVRRYRHAMLTTQCDAESRKTRSL